MTGEFISLRQSNRLHRSRHSGGHVRGGLERGANSHCYRLAFSLSGAHNVIDVNMLLAKQLKEKRIGLHSLDSGVGRQSLARVEYADRSALKWCTGNSRNFRKA